MGWPKKNRIVAVLPIAARWGSQCLAQSVIAPNSLTDFSKETENPVTRQITLPLQYQADFLYGPYQATKDTFEIDQAVVPFKFNDNWALITRTKLPLEVQPPKNLSSAWSEGLSNGYTTFFLSPEQGSGFSGARVRCSTIRPRLIRHSASTSGARGRQPHFSTRMQVRGSSAPSSTISGRLAARRHR